MDSPVRIVRPPRPLEAPCPSRSRINEQVGVARGGHAIDRGLAGYRVEAPGPYEHLAPDPVRALGPDRVGSRNTRGRQQFVRSAGG